MKHKPKIKVYIEGPYNTGKRQSSKGASLDRQGRVWKNDLMMSDSTSQRPR